MTTTQASADYFDQVANDWDQISAGYFGKQIREAAISKAYLRPEMVVADVGSGTGYVAAGIAALVKQVNVVDNSAAMLEVAKKNLSAFGNIQYFIADGADLPFPDGSLDAVFANMYLHHTLEPAAAIREMARVLRPGGRLVITDMDEHPNAWMKNDMADIWLGFKRDQLRIWYQDSDLVNVIVNGTGEKCCAVSSTISKSGQREHEERISVFVAIGTRKVTMRASVQENYSAIATAEPSAGCCQAGTDSKNTCFCTSSENSSNCCGEKEFTDVTFSTGYSQEELSSVPGEAADSSLGCGNPIAMANLKPGDIVLDIGSGGGLDAFLAADTVGSGGHVIGVDMTPAMLDRAKATAIKNNIQNVEFRHGYAEELPMHDESVDVIISNCVINLSEDKGLVFREAFRVLKPGGRLEVSDMVTFGSLPFEIRQSSSSWAECVSGALPEQEYLDLISQAGFQNTLMRRSTSMGETSGVSVYSIIVSAQKPISSAKNVTEENPSRNCGCSSANCCG